MKKLNEITKADVSQAANKVNESATSWIQEVADSYKRSQQVHGTLMFAGLIAWGVSKLIAHYTTPDDEE